MADGVVDECGGLGGVGEVGGDEEDLVGGLDGAAIEEGAAGGEDESGSGAAVAFGEREAEAAGAASDEDDLVGAASEGVGSQGVGGCCGYDAGENLSGVEGGSGFFHGWLDAVWPVIVLVKSRPTRPSMG